MKTNVKISEFVLYYIIDANVQIKTININKELYEQINNNCKEINTKNIYIKKALVNVNIK